MLTNFFETVRAFGVPATTREYLDLLAALDAKLIYADQEGFYQLSRTILVKDERHYDKFDKACQAFFNGLDSMDDMLEALIPEEWLRQAFIRQLSDDDKANIQGMKNLRELLDTFRQRMEEQKSRHQGGNKWIGTGGTSPFGAYGYNPSGIRIGQDQSRHRKATKVWDKREFKNLDDNEQLGSRNMKMALRRLRRFARQGAADQLDLDDTVRSTASKGMLDIKMVPERHNAVKVLLFMDIGGSMDDYVRLCEELFACCRTEFKHLEFYYFHNYLYESVWQDNRRRQQERISLWDVIHRYGKDYRVIFVGDAAMSPYEITSPGGSVEHFNEEAGHVWMSRLKAHFDRVAWLNPSPQHAWQYTSSTRLIDEQMEGKMFPLTINGLEEAMGYLAG
ncbi:MULTISPECIES: VWA domain-containing protein [Gammaproteobacteria]|uniref:vWA domain-containing protein n=1 Tax=Gammaproteobacteria TaxID=1236 RepID=UPI001ADCB8B3|nr:MULTISPECIES: VWA domain-containing protein [Gammaproteobacteria]MBO9481465.1 VWA domain-containing protein [Salinisphaera sp. G21_0]MBO9496059.1 VWA domain-containing protein [Thalassotalea sp. G20_0]